MKYLIAFLALFLMSCSTTKVHRAEVNDSVNTEYKWNNIAKIEMETSGNPVLLIFGPDQYLHCGIMTSSIGDIRFSRANKERVGGIRITNHESFVPEYPLNAFDTYPGLVIHPCAMSVIDFPEAGKHTYYLQARPWPGGHMIIRNASIFAYEIK